MLRLLMAIITTSGLLNVKDASIGAVGDGVVDDTAAIQAAVNACGDGQTVYFPQGNYLVTAPIAKTTPVRLLGASNTTQSGSAQASRVGGNFPDYIFKFNLAGIVSGCSIEGLQITNTNIAGGCILASNWLAPSSLTRLLLSAFRGITFTTLNHTTGSFTTLIQDIRAICAIAGQPIGSWGICATGQCSLVSTDVVAFDTGLLLSGSGIAVVGGRYETNRTGFLLGLDENGNDWQAANVSLSGFTMEANDLAIWLKHAASVAISAFSVEGSTGSPSNQSQVGIYVDSCSQTILQAGGTSGTFADIAWRVHSPCALISCAGSNSYPGQGSWDIPNPAQVAALNTNITNVIAPIVTLA